MRTVAGGFDAAGDDTLEFAGAIEEALELSTSMLGRGELLSTLIELAIDLAGDAIR